MTKKNSIRFIFANIAAYVLTFVFCGLKIESVLLGFFISALIILSIVDFKSYEIPPGINIFIFVLAVVNLVFTDNYFDKLIGFFAVSVVLFLIHIFTKGKGIGGGDVKLMAVSGLLLGWKMIILAFVFGCAYAVFIHSIRMKIAGHGRRFAFGPYLSMGLVTTVWFGERVLSMLCFFAGHGK